MSEWWTYTLSDIQSFSLHSYYRLFELYNRAIWPAQIAALLLGFAVWFLIRRGRGRLAATILAACWLWVAIVFHAHRYATLTWTARYFAWGFGLEAALLFGRRLAFENRRAGRAIFAFALLVQPLVLASQSVPLDFRPAHIVAEPLMLTAQIVEVLLRVTRRRRILWVPRHAPVMPDSRAPYTSKLLGVSVPRCVGDGEERISRALTR